MWAGVLASYALPVPLSAAGHPTATSHLDIPPPQPCQCPSVRLTCDQLQGMGSGLRLTCDQLGTSLGCIRF